MGGLVGFSLLGWIELGEIRAMVMYVSVSFECSSSVGLPK
jgi:hypothetical protein